MDLGGGGRVNEIDNWLNARFKCPYAYRQTVGQVMIMQQGKTRKVVDDLEGIKKCEIDPQQTFKLA